MKKIIIIVAISFIGVTSYSQISFENGYFINNSGLKTECFIRNLDWKNNPTEFEYKLSNTSQTKIETIDNVTEFSISESLKYVRSLVDIDRSEYSVVRMSNSKELILSKERLFLKVLIEGKSSLYSYEDGSLRRYFYKIDSLKINQLDFKRYKVSAHEIGENNRYKQQIWNNLKCSDITVKDIEKINYKANDLIKFFIKYNECKNSIFNDFNKNEEKDLFNLTIRPGIGISSFSINRIKNPSVLSGHTALDLAFDSELVVRFGIEAEIILPFNKNKWSLIIEPTYQGFKSEKEWIYLSTPLVERTTNVKVDFKSIGMPIGVRHYSFLNDKLKLFFNASYVINFTLSSTLKSVDSSLIDLNILSRNNLALGIGFNYQNKFNLELRHGLSRSILVNYVYWDSNYQNTFVIFGYTIF